MDTTKLFLQLTSETYPHGTERQLEHILPKGIEIDEYGNYFMEIGDDYTTMFTSHLDTACGSSKTGKKQKIKHGFSKDKRFVFTKSNTILGGDCKAGVVIMMNMIKNKIPGLYYFFLGEEVGCLGSKWLAEKMYKGEMFIGNKIDKVISFDRKGTNSIITYQWAGRCASDSFADGLIEEFSKNDMKMTKDPTGVCTDSIQFQDFIPECTNISTGYYDEHTSNEKQDVKFLSRISEVVTKINWESLPVKRDPSVTDYGNFWEEWEEEEEMGGGIGYGGTRQKTKTWHKDFTCNMKNHKKESVEVYISLERIFFEKQIIRDILLDWGFGENVEIDDVDWNGNHLMISWDGTSMDALSRTDLSYSDSRLNRIDGEDIMVVSEENEKFLVDV